MEISVTRFRATCLELIRQVVARLAPPPRAGAAPRRPWERLRGSGELVGEPGDSVLETGDLEANR